jgi:hypothetical protein
MSLDQSDTSERKPVVVASEPVAAKTTTVVESAPLELSPVDEDELKRREEEERLEQEGLNATIDSIFTLPSDDEVKPHLRTFLFLVFSCWLTGRINKPCMYLLCHFKP